MAPDSQVAVTGVQPIAIVDHIARLSQDELRAVVGDQVGGSRRVERDTINSMLQKAGAAVSLKLKWFGWACMHTHASLHSLQWCLLKHFTFRCR